MSTKVTNQVILQIVAGTVPNLINGFLTERKNRGLSKHTIKYYDNALSYFGEYLEDIGVVTINEVTSDVIRHYLLNLGKKRNQGGVHSAYRANKAWLNWTWDEFELEDRNPIIRLKIPAGNNQPLPGIKMEDVRKMINACTTDMALRDKAILMTLVDKGIRRAEIIALDINDVELISGKMIMKHGKGNKSRSMYLGRKSKRVLRRYLKTRNGMLNPTSPLFSTVEGARLSLSGLREIVRRRALNAGIEEPGLHDFRRCFAVQMLRNGCDLVTLSRLMGHSTLAVTQRYLHLVDEDLMAEHQLAGPIDNANL